MSRLLINSVLLPTKALVNAYTWTTLPFYSILQRPWKRLKLSANQNVKIESKNGNTIYSRESPAKSHPFYKYETVPQLFPLLEQNQKILGIRDVISEHVALDENKNPVKVDGKILKKVQLASEYRWLTRAQVMEHVDAIAKGLKNLAIKKGDNVLIYAENCPEWFYSSLALAKLNAVTVTLYSTLSDSGVVFGMNQSDAQYVICSQALLPKLHKLTDQLLHLKTIIYIDSNNNKNKQIPKFENQKLFPLSQIESIGSSLPVCDFPTPDPSDTVMIMYTSGTTGNPKGVTITHKNLYSTIANTIKYDEEENYLCMKSDCFAAYLPMAHIFGYILNLVMFLSESKIAICSPMTLLNSSPAHVPGQIGDLQLIRPEFMIAVPLMLERILKEIYRKLNERSPLAAPLFTYLMDYKIRWSSRGFQTPIINRLICKKISDQFGGKLQYIAVSGAPLHARTQALVKAALNVNIMQVYGSTEMVGTSHAHRMCDLSIGTCGVPEDSFKVFLKDWPEGGYFTTDKPNPRGEIVTGGDCIALGYYKLPGETDECFFNDQDGTRWFQSGDIGEVMPNGTLKIIDRKKEITKLANGEFISLGKIEAGFRNSPFVENICICTDPFRNHITALISPNRRTLQELAEKLGKSKLSFDRLCDDPQIIKHVLDSIQQLGREMEFHSEKEIPTKITLVKEEWSQENNLLTAAFKMRRKQVNHFYQDQIKQMFDPKTDSTE